MAKKQLFEVEGRELAISNAEKVYYPENGFTKGEVIAFYSKIEGALLPHLRDRPLTLKRTVMVWDQGEYEDLTGNPAAAFHQGKMHVIMRGKKLKGEWILVKDRREEDNNKWLLIKAGKALKLYARADDTSAISGRSMRQIAKANDSNGRATVPLRKQRLQGAGRGETRRRSSSNRCSARR